MLRSSYEPNLSDQDHELFATLVPAEHYLRQVARRRGRQVVVNDYAVEYAGARQQATTERYREVRREHPAIEMCCTASSTPLTASSGA